MPTDLHDWTYDEAAAAWNIETRTFDMYCRSLAFRLTSNWYKTVFYRCPVTTVAISLPAWLYSESTLNLMCRYLFKNFICMMYFNVWKQIGSRNERLLLVVSIVSICIWTYYCNVQAWLANSAKFIKYWQFTVMRSESSSYMTATAAVRQLYRPQSVSRWWQWPT